LREAARGAGFDVESGGYFNTLLFPLVAMRRMLARIGIGRDDDARMPSPALNAVLGAVFGLERLVVPRIKFPFGTSVIAVLRASSAGRAPA
jgi:hypothetical protein